MNSYNVAIIRGDGIGPEIVQEGLNVLSAISNISGIDFNFVEYPFGAEHYLRSREIMPDYIIRELEDFDAIYLGAIGDPRVEPSILELGLILKIRFELDQYVNLRPVKLYPNVESPLINTDGIDFYIVRENTEDFYNGIGTIIKNPARGKHSNVCIDLKRSLYDMHFSLDSSISSKSDYGINIGFITKEGSNRVIQYAFDLAEQYGKQKVTSVDKANVLPHMYNIWRESFENISKNYHNIESNYTFVDAITMWFVKNPDDFGVVVAPNLFGDIITDLGAAIAGGLGFAAGANINPKGVSMFEPIHGSAPKYKGKNIANPIATILSGALMLNEIGEKEMGDLIDKAVTQALGSGAIKTYDMGGTTSTTEVGAEIVTKIYEIGNK